MSGVSPASESAGVRCVMVMTYDLPLWNNIWQTVAAIDAGNWYWLRSLSSGCKTFQGLPTRQVSRARGGADTAAPQPQDGRW